MTVSPATLAKLRKFDTPTICNVIEFFEVRPRNAGYMDGRIRANFPELPPMVGFACTAAFRSDAPPKGGDAYGSVERQLEAFDTRNAERLEVVLHPHGGQAADEQVIGIFVLGDDAEIGVVSLVAAAGGRQIAGSPAVIRPGAVSILAAACRTCRIPSSLWRGAGEPLGCAWMCVSLGRIDRTSRL